MNVIFLIVTETSGGDRLARRGRAGGGRGVIVGGKGSRLEVGRNGGIRRKTMYRGPGICVEGLCTALR